MKKDYTFYEKLILRDFEVPKLITSEWLTNEYKNNDSFARWGFVFSDLSDHKFDENIDINILNKIKVSTKTIFPEKLPNGYNYSKHFDKYKSIGMGIEDLHQQGIDGSTINVAVIDHGFEIIPYEIEEILFKYHQMAQKNNPHFHGSVVSSYLVGKDMGIAPKSKLYFYEMTQMGEMQMQDVVCSLKDIYEKNTEGANIRVVNLSSSLHREKEEYYELVAKLKEQGCTVIDSRDFAKTFTCANYISFERNNDNIDLSDWQKAEEKDRDFFKNKVLVVAGGRTIPLVETENDYMLCTQSSYSWAIPIISGMFALSLQIDNNLTYEEFETIARETATENDKGFNILNPKGIIETLENTKIAEK